ncbi:MAG TPA: hypothetical protein VN213_09160, partial [Solirubrobacteraceae bacterium]|nr:hypothetical protein [Solirubrobacteraceae bacterium]
LADATLSGPAADLGALRRAVGARWWHEALGEDAFARIDAGLRAGALEWDRLAPGSSLVRIWRPPSARDARERH